VVVKEDNLLVLLDQLEVLVVEAVIIVQEGQVIHLLQVHHKDFQEELLVLVLLYMELVVVEVH